MTALVVNSLSTFGMMLILTYQLQSVMRYPALGPGWPWSRSPCPRRPARRC